ncbi:molybdenum cofactor guanylyltransferase [Peptococcaceae bacterium]|nr:molybdenum cofactor guanylyltransferase [Peptococcaceae bacterium]
MNFSAAVLAGGKSSRMGTDKAFLEIKHCCMIDRVLSELRKITDDILIITNNLEKYNYRDVYICKDIYQDVGPIAGIHSALVHSQKQAVLIVACDMPFIKASLAKYLVDNLKDYDAVVPVINSFFEPLFAVYKTSCIPYIEQYIEHGKRKISGFFSLINLKCIDERHISSIVDPNIAFYNVNTPKELKLAKAIANKN